MSKNLDRAKMLRDINRLVNNDWAFDMSCKVGLPNQKPFTQKEAKQMAATLGRIYGISHCITCSSCQKKYLTAPKDIK